MVIVTAGVLFMFSAVTFIYFQMGAKSGIFKMDRIRASVSSEAGAALALHHLQAMDSFNAFGSPYQLSIEGDSSGWITIEHTGITSVVIDPVNASGGAGRNGAVEIRSRGVAGDVTVDLFARAAPAYPSSFALATHEGIPQGFFVDGREVNGLVHSNGVIHFSSITGDSTADPSVAMVSTTSSGGFNLSGVGITDKPHVEGSSVWVRPYPLHSQGRPFWDTCSPELSFIRMYQYFSELASAPAADGVVRIQAERLLIDGDRIVYRLDQNSGDNYISLDSVSLVIVRNTFTPVMVKGTAIPNGPLTILATGDIEIGGSVDGGAVGSGGPLGLVTLGDMIVAADPDLHGGSDWEGRWQIETDRGLSLRACLVIPDGSLRAELPYLPRDKTRITVSGSIVQYSMGRLSSGPSGYDLGLSWDEGLGSVHPPFFPLVGRWNVYSWLPEVEGMEETDLLTDMI